tara:strand:+ start:57 stop:314 length:258 start_codon:yes stop_codon:yes gene_type:complete
MENSKKTASIRANITAKFGTILDRYSMIGAGPVVTRDFPDFALIVGNPVKEVGWVGKNGTNLDLDKSGISRCGNFKFSVNRVSET